MATNSFPSSVSASPQSKSLRDRLKILERDCKARKRGAERGSGISPEYREIDQIMEDYLERGDEEEAKQGKESIEDRNN
ncbi:hypothetical protein P5673_029543 [Acropora cervicornis]|uniref:Uncharacterized protein n=1 Tax=Acropora cervicornis TaxID=6130 RepID=A0AAD9PVP2_ACRCE|nr:hypothetical protein P5673_029543 [Acropora cervicornis]